MNDIDWSATCCATLRTQELVTTGNGLTVVHFMLTSDFSQTFTPTDAKALGGLFHSILCGDEGIRGSRAVVKNVYIFCNTSLMPLLYSALPYAWGVGKLSLNMYMPDKQPAECTRIWERLAFACFSRYARSRSALQHIELGGIVLGDVDVDAIEAVLRSEDPINLLFGHPATSEAGRVGSDSNEQPAATDYATVTGMLKQGTTVTLVPAETNDVMPEESPHWALTSDVYNVTVLRGDEDGGADIVRVLVPGFGVCKVQRDQVIPASAQLIEDGGVHSLDLRFDEDEPITGLPRLMKLIDSPLTRLALDLWHGVRPYMPEILRSCPNLKHMSCIFGRCNTQAFLAIYRETAMTLEQVSCDFDDMVTMYEELTDPSTRLARTRRGMSCEFENTEDFLQRTGHLDCVTNMLRANRKLELMELKVPPWIYEDVVAELEGFDNESLPVVLEPLPLEERLAFLSIFKSPSDGEERFKKLTTFKRNNSKPPTSSMLAKLSLDRLVVDTIFQFAATPVRRHVNVVCLSSRVRIEGA